MVSPLVGDDFEHGRGVASFDHHTGVQAQAAERHDQRRHIQIVIDPVFERGDVFDRQRDEIDSQLKLNLVARRDDEPAVVTAVERAGASDVVARLPSGLETQLGPTWPGGVDVSNAIFLLIGAFVFVLLAGIGAVSGDGQAVMVLTLVAEGQQRLDAWCAAGRSNLEAWFG